MDDLEYNELIEKAHLYGSESNWNKCIDCYEKAFSIMIKADDLLDLAIVYLENDNSFKALNAIEAVIKAHPDDFKGYFYKGLYFEHLEQDDNALDYYLKALDLRNDVSEIYFKIGRIYDDKGDEESIDNKYINKAIYYYKETLKLDEKHYYANLNLGSIYEKQNRIDDALKYTLISHDSNPNEKMSSFNLGVIYSKMGDNEKAVKCYLEEVNKKEFYPYSYYNLGLIFKDIYHDLIKSKEYYLLGLKYLRNDPSLWYNLACCHVLLNDYDNALDCFYCAVSLNNQILDFIEKDKEVEKFINSLQYQELKNKFKAEKK